MSAAYGIGQYFGWDAFLPAASYHVGEGIWTIVRPPGTLGYASYFATWLVFVVLLSLGLRTIEESEVWRRIAVATAILATCAILLTGTRAAMVGLVAGGLIWMAVRRVHIPRRALVLAGVTIVSGAVFYFTPPGQQLRSRTRWFVEDPWGGARGNLWRDSLHMAVQRLPAGYGPETFTSEFPRFESVKLAQAYPDFAHESPHNMFLDALVSQGLPGLLLLVLVCATGFAAAFRLKQPALAAALAAGVVSQQFTAFTVPTAVIFFVTVGLLVALDTPVPEPRRRMPVTAAATALAAALLYLAVRFAAADHALALVKRGLDDGDLFYAEAQYKKHEVVRLPGSSADVWYSRALLGLASRSPQPQVRAAAVREAGAAATNATQTADDPFNAWYNLAVFCGLQDNGPCTERSLRAAIRAHPNWFKPHWTLAQVLLLEGHREEAYREAAIAVKFNGGKDPEVLRTLEGIRAQSAAAQPRTNQE